ncbi:17S U2 SnRNP complex component HTATSF1 [Scleropages formosus]|nr:HIV Tat-specific factor 1 [Scleropages formosus]
MSSNSDGNQEFHEQLRLQELYGEKRDDGNDPFTYVDPQDGTIYDWDHDKKAWFPRVTEDFLAAYQASYGVSEEVTAVPVEPKKDPVGEVVETPKQTPSGTAAAQPKDGKTKAEKRKADPGWFDVDKDKNTNVYVSGLPLDITPEEFVEVMSKCGIIMRDPVTDQYKIKLYKDDQGNLKGDGLCCYLKRESVPLAERLLDDTEIRGYHLHVEAAHFQLKGQYDASKKKKKSKEYRKKLQQQQKQLDWRPEKTSDARKRHERVVIIQNMFHPKDFEEDPLVLNEIREDLRTECEKFGQVKKVIIFDRHPDGVASVAFKEPEHADMCQVALDGRWFGGRKLSVQLWDGTTDYQVEETNREREERLKGWSAFLEGNKASAEGDAAKDGSSGGSEKDKGQEKASLGVAESSSTTEVSSSEQRQSVSQAKGGTVEVLGSDATPLDTPEIDSTDSSLAGSDEEHT